MATLHDDALCLRQWDWSETSQTAIIFTRTHGLLRVLAKGSRRPVPNYSGGLEILSRAQAGFILRPNTELALLTEWDLTQTFSALRTNLSAHTTALFVADLLQHTIRDHDPHPLLWDVALRTLETLGSVARADTLSIPLALLKFQWSLLVECGYRPVIDADARNGAPLSTSGHLGFDPTAGGFISLAGDAPDADPPAASLHNDHAPTAHWRVRSSTLALIREVATSQYAMPSGMPTPDALSRANRLLAAYLRHILGEEPPTMRVVFPTRLPR